MDRLMRVLIVEDSAFARRVLKELLERSPFIEVVGTATNGLEALGAVSSLKPDVVTCDLTMPEMDGPSFVKAQMSAHPLPIVITSAHDCADELTLAALEAGAVSFVRKPTKLANDHLYAVGRELVAAVKLAAQSHPLSPAQSPTFPVRSPTTNTPVDAVLIGTSTGGPAALARVVPRLPGDLGVPVGLVVHMPVGFTEMYAERLDKTAALTVVEARDGDVVRPDTVYVAAGGRHLTFRRQGARVLVSSDLEPASAIFRPSVDRMFESGAELWGDRTLGVVLTGMGNDGTEGARAIKAKSGHMITEAESTCVVYGMPRSVVEANLSDQSLPIDAVADAIAMRVRRSVQ